METEQKQTQHVTPAGDGTQVGGMSPMGEPASVQTAPAFKNRKVLGLSLFGLVFMLAISYAGYFMNGGPVAIVNGVEIARADYEKNVKLFEEAAAKQGADITDATLRDQIRTQSLDMLVNTALLKTAALKAGIVASPEEVERIFNSFTAQMNSNEELKKNVAALGLTDEKMRANIEERLLVDAYIESHSDIKNITVTDEEVTALFNSLPQNAPTLDISEAVNENPGLTAEGEVLPPTEPAPKLELTAEMKEQFSQQIRVQKQQEIIGDLIEKIRAESVVEIHL